MATPAFEDNKLVGARIRRREDPRFLQGRGRYVDDLRHRGLLHLAFVRSEVAHAAVRSVDVSAARAVPGVVGAYAAADLARLVKPIRAVSHGPGYQVADTPVLATDRVRYVGEPLAAVVAESRYEAEDGAEAVVVDSEPLPAVTTMEQALADGAPAIHDAIAGNLFNHFELQAGDTDAAFAAADFVYEAEYRAGRVAPVALEPRAVIAEWDPTTEELTVWASHQAPHLLRTGLSEYLTVPESRIRVISPDVGGGFGSKLILYVEDLAVAAVARLTGSPVKWVADRREDLLTAMHGREQTHTVQAAVREDGRVLGLRVKIMASNGAYAIWPMTAGLDSGQASENVTGPYDIPHYDRDVSAVVTNKTPMGPYRGVGRPMACFTIERTMDEIAARLGLEPLEVRRRNVIRSYPHQTAAGLVLESGSSAEALDDMEKLLDVGRFRAEQAELRERGVYRGVGVAAVVEHSALGTQEVARKGIDIGLGLESAIVRAEPDGHLTAIVGTHSHGQGHETTFAQVVADEFGLPLERVTVRFGDTAVVPYGLGTWASRSLVYAGGAAILAARDVRDKALEIAAHELEASPADLEMVGGEILVKGSPSKKLSFADVARIAIHKPQRLPEEIEPGLESTRRYRAPDPGSFSNSLHGVVVEVDVKTGEVRLLRYVVIEDCGTIVNPLIVDGQVHGGTAQGIGQALLEEVAYDESGQPLTTTFMDYLIPGFNEVPRMEIHHLSSPSPHSIGGFKGMGEGGAINPPAAIANAVTDALRPFGVRVDHVPIARDWIVRSVDAARDRAGAAGAGA
ncbi:MAG: aerobic carbon-monoxide dehydrogenase large subunit [Solirubrobacteraceae bacterium]|jgi:carbon-monoxide dehydrogenase large subunit|nr:aerobic carbon-monoxide dehydrogenase large subunit [Solirubrobacteraceae bacterium]